MEALRAQISETQNARSDLMKWKLVIVAALGGAALGVNNQGARLQYLLCFVPFVCVYVDALCAHLSLRIIAIGDFIAAEKPRTPDEERECDYEMFLRTDTSPFRLETLALHWSTILLCFIVAGAGFVLPVSETVSSRMGDIVRFLSGVVGIVFTLGVWAFHNIRVKAIKKAAKEWKKKTFIVVS